eukprot:CAMPEP_0203678896 /NCGR_PEP_ID=MMETSP0090-20130426/33667_1 /ASSEMBLY_ACC=CAM_ASM_001088 /TAXON_ID=426623 /ORGANISM="Chaetoceros affinis, Strain CCMP159" /LENGTH=510 /DNA_ID=CAMNT_0050546339 /DNA_START=48 /DNA_END=1580 /DNA_ORIENTATION=+
MATFRRAVVRHADRKRTFFLAQQKRFQSSSPPSSSYSSLFMSGHGWTGAFGTGPDTMFSPETSSVSAEDRESSFTSIHQHISEEIGQVVNAAAGWGHTVLQCKNYKGEIKTYVAGRPYDFQALLRLNRLPCFVRRAAISMSLKLDEEADLGFLGSNAVEGYFKLDDMPAFQKTVLPQFQEIQLPDGDVPLVDPQSQTLAASAGLTALIGKSGKAYSFGLNKCGQCGVGDDESVHIWQPSHIELGDGDETKVTDVALGLQHGLVLDENGYVHAFGKSSRGQLGIALSREGTEEPDDSTISTINSSVDYEYSPIRVSNFEITSDSGLPVELPRGERNVKKIAAGFNHSAAITKSNHAFLWGKNVLLDPETLKAVDSLAPIQIKGLPQNLEILDISCGSHHTSILLEDGSVYATGITTDTKEQIGGKTLVQIIPPGLIDMPVRQFISHFDRTTVVAGECGEQVLEVQLWSTEELRKEAVFEPCWVEEMLTQTDQIMSVHRGWLHTVVVGGTDR